MGMSVSRQPLTAAMPNTVAWRLGEAAKQAGNPARVDVGDLIDRGLILLRLLNELGFDVIDTLSQATTEPVTKGAERR